MFWCMGVGGGGGVSLVAQLADVARPGVESIFNRGGGVGGARASGRRRTVDEVGEQRDVAATLAERRQRHRHHREAVVEVLAELPADLVARSRFVAATTRTSTRISADRRPA